MDCVFAPLSPFDAAPPHASIQRTLATALPANASVQAARALLETAAVALEAAFDILFAPTAQGQGVRTGAGFQQAAVHRCLKSATGLLDISQTLLLASSTPSRGASPIAWHGLADDATVASRAGFAALTLSNPTTLRPADPHAASH